MTLRRDAGRQGALVPAGAGGAGRHARRDGRRRRCSTSEPGVTGDRRDTGAALPVPACPTSPSTCVLALLPGALGVAFVGYTDNILTGRAFADRRRRPHRPQAGAARPGRGEPRRPGLMHGFPVSSSGSRTAIGDAARRPQPADRPGHRRLRPCCPLLTLRPVLAAFPTAALGAVVVYAAIRLIDVAEFRRFASFRRSELAARAGHHRRPCSWSVSCYGVLVAIGLSVLDLLRRVARPHDAVQGFVPGLAGMHDVDDYPEARAGPRADGLPLRLPAVLRQRRGLPRRALAAVAGAGRRCGGSCSTPRPIVEVDITAVDALESLRQELAGGASSSPWPGSSRTFVTSSPLPACSAGSERTESSRRCPPRWRRTARGWPST